VRQQVGEAYKCFPARGRVRQAAIEADVEDQILPGGIAQRPEIAHSVASQVRLCKVPDSPGQRESPYDGMRGRQRLARLQAMRTVGLLVEERVGIAVKAFDVGTGQQQERVAGAAKIEVANAVVVEPAIVAGGDGGLAPCRDRPPPAPPGTLPRCRWRWGCRGHVVAIEWLVGHDQFEDAAQRSAC
jgi:hypothetical protein